jgi:N-acetylglutamate synthase-like GNAT family acetyltransferase
VIERTQWDLFWIPGDVRVIDRPDLLLLTCPRPAPYLNAVLRTRTADPTSLIAEAEPHFAGRRARWLVPDTFDTPPLTKALATSGWAPHEAHEVRVLPVDAWTRPVPPHVHRVDTVARLRDCMTASDLGFGRPTVVTDDVLARDLAQCVDGRRVARFVAYDDQGAPVASGGLTLFPDVGFGLLWAGATVPGARGRGAYAAVLGARIAHARAMGLRAVGLYAITSTSAPIVARFGFENAGEMTFWERDVPA